MVTALPTTMNKTSETITVRDGYWRIVRNRVVLGHVTRLTPTMYKAIKAGCDLPFTIHCNLKNATAELAR
jgi:hypothetical protein